MLTLLASVLALQTLAEPKPLERMAEAVQKHRAVSFTMVGGIGGRSERAKIRLRAPNRFAVIGPDFSLQSDGVRAWQTDVRAKTWREVPVDSELSGIKEFPGFGLLFPGAPKPYAEGPVRDEEIAGERVIGIPVAKPKEAPTGYVLLLLLDPKTWMPRGFKSLRDDKPYETFRFEDVVLDPPLRPTDFRFSAPKGYKNADS